MFELKNSKGFTLIEMLVVIAIIAILASIFLVGLRGFRGSAYDARRLSDVTKIQSALELYYNQTRTYPSTLAGLGTAYTSLPKDPLYTGSSGTGYYYCGSTDGQSYVVGAKLSGPNSATKDSLHNLSVCTSGSVPMDGGATPGLSGSLTCGVTNTDEYCVGPGSAQ